MIIRFGILISLLAWFVALPTSRVWSCSPAETSAKCHQNESAGQKSCCGKSGNENADTQTKTEKDCPCDHENGGCHCPGCGLVCSTAPVAADVPHYFSAIFMDSDAVKKQAFYFAEHLPEAVYLPIWQPPQLAV